MRRLAHAFFLGFMIFSAVSGSAQLNTPNHPELEWFTIETEHFYVHFYEETERSARVAAKIAEEVHGPVTDLYDVELDSKTHLILKDTDDYSNGAAYYYDNKIVIWALPLDFELRGSHNWLRDVITHEFTHIVQLYASMKFTRKVPAIYFQWINPEREHREDVIRGYPNTLVSYPVAGTVIPPWFAEGAAQYNVRETPYDYWDSHRDMILRDRVLHENLLSWNGMNVFGKKGVGNESVYNQGFSLVSYIAREYGDKSLHRITDEMQSPLAISFDNAVRRVTGRSGQSVYTDWADSLRQFYSFHTANIRGAESDIEVLSGESTGNFYPRLSPTDSLVAYLSNKGNDYLSQTGLFLYDVAKEKSRMISPFATSSAGWAPDGRKLVYTHPSQPTKYGSLYDDLYLYDLEKEEEERLTENKRVKNPDWSPTDSLVVYVSSFDGSQNLYLYDFAADSSRKITDFSNGEQVFAPRFSADGSSIVFDMNTTFGRDIYQYFLNADELTLLMDYRWDVRTPVLRNDTLTFADDRTGIFNIYQRDLDTGEEWALTNVTGGAFMPEVTESGMLYLALYEDAGYRLGRFEPNGEVTPDSMEYKNFPEEIPSADYNDENMVGLDAEEYTSQYSHMFLVPRLMIEYGTVKPGVYFFSNEILEQMSVIGSASINRIKDIDLFLAFDYNKLKPTLYADLAFLTRNITEKIYFHEELTGPNDPQEKADIRFTLMQTNFGVRGEWYRFPLGKLSWDLYGRFEQYSTFIKYLLSAEEIPSLPDKNNFISKLRYEYYIGRHLHFDVDWEPFKLRTGRLSYINSGTHLKTSVAYSYEQNDFINDFRISESGLLEEVYTPNNYHKIENQLNVGVTLPFWDKSALTGKIHTGWISKENVDDFFHFFGGGMPGIKGYPFYSIEGSRLWNNTVQWMVPLVTGANWRFVQFNFRDIYLGPYYQIGDAWTDGINNIEWKQAAGMELRIGGFSFYMYPTAITLDAAYGFNSFTLQSDDTEGYGEEWRYYLKLLFEFDT
ncbi:MAG: hypothetical protein K9N46_10965 [Candidatus Marinimicrobia bacterium]|nr:hypothetical protein [Candidatus Neomarinimicrobiota bacterium]MCF7827698.1 hypothetical protein [Candidatus Neomarinimicrobiota bacterium]MCF7881247.1 hypothetical protein [Candidatus Neomarinimicrobiota bacterium]